MVRTDIAFKKTNELTADEKTSICKLFFRVFSKDKSLPDFERQFAGTFLGYSYHGLIVHGGRIIGCWSFIPYRYSYFGASCTFALSVDTMIDQDHRGQLGNLMSTAEKAYEALRDDNIAFVFGFPNQNFYPVIHNILRWQDIGKLDFFALPINIGKIRKGLGVFNVFSRMYGSIVTMLAKTDRPSVTVDSTHSYHVQKVNDAVFLKQRYDQKYQVVNLSANSFFVYTVTIENDHVRTAYLVDVFPLEKKHVEQAVTHIYDKERKNIDIILYVGRLPFSPMNLIRIPERYQPKRVLMAGKTLLENIVGQEIYDIDNWNVNLSNFDVR